MLLSATRLGGSGGAGLEPFSVGWKALKPALDFNPDPEVGSVFE
jgi:hypothetical protein